MTHFQQLYDRDYLGSWDLPEDRDVIVTISAVKGGELVQPGGRKNKKPIIAFVGKDKRFVSNKTNSKAIAGMYGNHVEKWVGKKIALYVSTTRDPSTGGDIPCIRVRPQVPPERDMGAAPVVQEEDITLQIPGEPLNPVPAPQASPPPTPSPAEAAFISVDQAIALEDALKANNKSKEKLLANVSRQYGVKIERLAQIRSEDWEAAMAYASPQSDAA